MFYPIKFIDILKKMTKICTQKKNENFNWWKAAMPNYILTDFVRGWSCVKSYFCIVFSLLHNAFLGHGPNFKFLMEATKNWNCKFGSKSFSSRDWTVTFPSIPHLSFLLLKKLFHFCGWQIKLKLQIRILKLSVGFTFFFNFYFWWFVHGC